MEVSPGSAIDNSGPARLPWSASVFVAVGLGIASVVGLGREGRVLDVVTSTAGVLVPGFGGQDAIDLALGLPFLGGAMLAARRGSAIGRSLWAGALLFVAYGFIRFAIAAPFGPLFLVHLLLVVVPIYALAVLLTATDGEAVRARLEGAVPARWVAGVMLFLGVATLGQDASGAWLAQGTVDPVARAVWIADLTLEVPAMLVGGALLWRRRTLGYLVAPGLLVQFGLTPVGIAALLAAQPRLTGHPADVGGIVGLLVFALIAGAPVALFARRPTDVNTHLPAQGGRP